MDFLGNYDVVVVGAGHAGIEAAHAAAMLGAKTAIFTLTLDFIGNMPCNPSIGGTAKGHLVREIDALGGLMGIAADATFLQSRMLNRGKGPAVHSLRVQTDRKRYHMWMKHALELTPNLEIHQAEIVRLDVQNGHVCGVVTALGGYYSCKCVVIATGTALGGRIFVGEAHYDGGPDGTHAATALTKDLTAHGVPLRRFKTGTPARVHRRSIDFSKLDCQPGDPDELLQPFSFMTHKPMHNKVDCLRFANVYGPHIDCLRKQPPFVGYMIRELYYDRVPEFHSDGNQRRDYIYVDDLIDLAMRVWDQPGFDAVNVSSNKNYSVRELYATACELMGKQIEAKYCPSSHYWAKYPELYGGAYGIKPEILDHEVNKYSLCDNTHAKECYGWEPKIDIREGLRRVIENECAMLAARDAKGE